MTGTVESPPGGRLGPFVLAAAAIAGAAVCLLMVWPFVGAITWALALAILFVPVHVRIERRLKHPTLAAMVSVAVLAIVVVVPAVFVVERLVAEAASGAMKLQERVSAGELTALLEAYPRLAPAGAWIERQLDLPALTGSVASWLSNMGATFVKGSVLQVVEVLLTFYLLFYFLRDRLAARRMIRNALPLSPAESEKLFSRVFDTVHATVYGTLAVAAIQGVLGGLMFWVLGLPTPLLWGIVMGLLSVVPVLGAFVVWIPASVLLALNGSWVRALILAVWGALAVGSIDKRAATDPGRQHAAASHGAGLHLHDRRPCPVRRAGFHPRPLAVTVTILLMGFWSDRVDADDEVAVDRTTEIPPPERDLEAIRDRPI